MANAPNQLAGTNLSLTGEERSALLELLEETLRDTHVEARRTENMEFRQQLRHQEALLRSLIEKLRL